MARLIAFLLMSWSCLLSAAEAAKPRCTAETELDPSVCYVRFPRIVRISIEENGAGQSNSSDPYAECPKFIVDEKRVRRYFGKAGVMAPSPGHSVDYSSPCYAAGTLQFADGVVAKWTIDAAEAGTLQFPGRRPLKLYCTTC